MIILVALREEHQGAVPADIYLQQTTRLLELKFDEKA